MTDVDPTADPPPTYIGTHCPWCHGDFASLAGCYEHVSRWHFDNDPEDWSMIGAFIGHARQLDAGGVTDEVGLVFLYRYNAGDSDDGSPGVAMAGLWMTPDAARQLGSHLLEQTEPARLEEVRAIARGELPDA